MSYGIGYMGSKSRIAKELIKIFPSSENFYDIFGGGFSVTHAMLEHRRHDYKYFHFNEIRDGVCELVQDAILGKYSYNNFTPEWISRERFFTEKESNAYIKLLWSFGNGGRTYIYGKNIEKQKQSLHNAVVFNQFDDFVTTSLKISGFDTDSINKRRLELPKLLKNNISLNDLQSLEALQRLQRLQRLQQLDKLCFTSQSFENINIKQNSVVYCDPPYLNTGKYDKNILFNRKLFLEWINSLSEPCFVSEYQLELTSFKKVWTKKTLSTMNSKNFKQTIENVFANKQAIELIETQSKMFSLS